ncbi:unnamed protein product [Protopolystoma xenopodis]|uniref:Uncharacterized protein n=1 Tax=Protopolystoma xenopodis TaxID=117903 RepID=A0A3S5CP66_9PLAT|nr:unnamed protein product [Protopolystoma xenopodis]
MPFQFTRINLSYICSPQLHWFAVSASSLRASSSPQIRFRPGSLGPSRKCHPIGSCPPQSTRAERGCFEEHEEGNKSLSVVKPDSRLAQFCLDSTNSLGLNWLFHTSIQFSQRPVEVGLARQQTVVKTMRRSLRVGFQSRPQRSSIERAEEHIFCPPASACKAYRYHRKQTVMESSLMEPAHSTLSRTLWPKPWEKANSVGQSGRQRRQQSLCRVANVLVGDEIIWRRK